jgi:hypothetical protein
MRPHAHAASRPVAATAPLAPRLEFAEPIAVGDVVLLVIHAQSGAPLRDAVANFDSTSRVGLADTLGRIRFRRVPPGSLRLRVRRVGYLDHDLEFRQSHVGFADRGALAMLVMAGFLLDQC